MLSVADSAASRRVAVGKTMSLYALSHDSAAAAAETRYKQIGLGLEDRSHCRAAHNEAGHLRRESEGVRQQHFNNDKDCKSEDNLTTGCTAWRGAGI